MIEYLEVGTKLMCSRSFFMLRECGRIHKKVFTRGRAYGVLSVKQDFIVLVDDDKIDHLLYEDDLSKHFFPI